MSKSSQLRVSRTRTIPVPNEYILALRGEYAEWSYDEERTPGFRGRWRELAFGGLPTEAPVDLEIGTGNGLHFAHYAAENPTRSLVGIELKYKPLIQSIRRARRLGCVNARISRYNAALVHEMFTPGEINDAFIFFPDPWEKLRQRKHRLIQDEFLERLHVCQRPGSRLVFKTDSRDYFEWALERLERSKYRVLGFTRDLHRSEFADGNFITAFERIFLRQGLQIGYAVMER